MPVNEAGTTEIYASAATATGTAPATATGATSTAAATGSEIYPLGFLPTIGGLVDRLLGGRRAPRRWSSGWNYDLGAEFGHNDFDYEIGNTLNASLGPCLDVRLRARAPTASWATRTIRGSRTRLSFFAGRVLREEFLTGAERGQARRAGPAGAR